MFIINLCTPCHTWEFPTYVCESFQWILFAWEPRSKNGLSKKQKHLFWKKRPFLPFPPQLGFVVPLETLPSLSGAPRSSTCQANRYVWCSLPSAQGMKEEPLAQLEQTATIRITQTADSHQDIFTDKWKVPPNERQMTRVIGLCTGIEEKKDKVNKIQTRWILLWRFPASAD